MEESEGNLNTLSELNVSFGYQCNGYLDRTLTLNDELGISCTADQSESSNFEPMNNSFSCLSGAALSANFTLASTNICNCLFGGEILESLDSPTSFRTLRSSPSMSRFGLLSPSSHMSENGGNLRKYMSSPSRIGSSSFPGAGDMQMASGAAGEDRVQAVYSEENGWLFCGIYDGFNGRDAADFLAAALYEKIVRYFYHLELNIKKQNAFNASEIEQRTNSEAIDASEIEKRMALSLNSSNREHENFSTAAFRIGLLDFLARSLAEVENDFLAEVEETMEARPDIVSIGSCVLIVLLHWGYLYVLNLGDSKAVLAFCDIYAGASLQAIQLTETHTVDNESERTKIVADHPDDPSVISSGRVKGKLKLTRAFGVGYLKKRNFNDALMGILQVRDLLSPPYIYTHPFCMYHRVSDNDLFVVLGSDGLFDFFKNDEVVEIVHRFLQCNPYGDPAKHLIEKLLLRAAENAGFSTEELMRIPAGSRRRYHDDITVIVIIFGNMQRTTKAATGL